MSNTPEQLSSHEMNLLFEKLSPQDVADFYIVYQQWLRQQHMTHLQTQIIQVQQQIAENNRQLQLVHPSPIALASLARLQSNGVTDLDLLDRMLERGETWLDSTIQHLEYCEKFDFIRGNYTEWCEHALEGAYDWIDSMRKVSIEAAKSPPQFTDHSPLPSLSQASTGTETDETLEEATEEIFLQKLMSETELEDTLPSLQAISLSAGQDQPASIDPTPVLLDETPAQPSSSEVTNTTAPIPLDETSAIATENAAATTLIPDQEALNITPEETAGTTQVPTAPAEDTSTPLAEHISAAPVPAEILPSGTTTIPPESLTASGASPLSTEPEPASAQAELQPAAHTTIDANDTPGSTQTVTETATSEHIEIEDEITIVPLPSINLHAEATSDTIPTPTLSNEVTVAPADPASEDTTEAATHPLLPAQEVSNIPTLPEIPTMPALQSQEETIEPARPSVLPPKKRNFFQRLFSIFSRS